MKSRAPKYKFLPERGKTPPNAVFCAGLLCAVVFGLVVGLALVTFSASVVVIGARWCYFCVSLFFCCFAFVFLLFFVFLQFFHSFLQFFGIFL